MRGIKAFSAEKIKLERGFVMSKIRRTQNNKKEDGSFKKKNIKHGRKESTRAVFHEPTGETPD